MNFQSPTSHLSISPLPSPKGWEVGINLSRKSSGSGSTIGGLPFVIAGPPSLFPLSSLLPSVRSAYCGMCCILKDTANPDGCYRFRTPSQVVPAGVWRGVPCHHAPTSSLQVLKYRRRPKKGVWLPPQDSTTTRGQSPLPSAVQHRVRTPSKPQ